MLDYIRDGAEIYARSFATIRAEADLSAVPADLEKLAVRVIHACGMVDIVADLRWSPRAGMLGRTAVLGGAPILCDSAAVARGITRPRLPAANPVITLDDDAPAWREKLAGAVVAIGTRPDVLHSLLASAAAGGPRPALVLGFPVGFTGAAEAKVALLASDLPFVLVEGTRGGAAMAVAAVNALASERE